MVEARVQRTEEKSSLLGGASSRLDTDGGVYTAQLIEQATKFDLSIVQNFINCKKRNNLLGKGQSMYFSWSISRTL